MDNKWKYPLFWVVIFLFATHTFSTAQSIADPEKEYSNARELASEGKYEEARALARRLVNQYPEYGDARVLLGRIVAWQGDYREAEAIVDTLLLSDPGNSDATDLKNDIRRWSRGSSRGISFDNEIRGGYLFDTYSEPYDRLWQVFSAGAGHRFGTCMTSLTMNFGFINTGGPSSVRDNDMQMVIEAWPEIGARNYAYLSYAWSPGPWFPKHRAAAEVWETLPEGWAASAGLNYYFFDRSIFIATASVEKYTGNYWFSGRGYFHFKEIGITTSFYLTARRYFNASDYLQLTAGAGTAPDEPFDIMTDLERQRATSIRIAWYKKVNSGWAFRVGCGYSYEKYNETDYRNRFEGSVNLIKGFGKQR